MLSKPLLVLAFIGAALGLFVATGTIGAFRALAGDLPRLSEAAIDARMLGYTTICAVTVALICGLAPAAWSARSQNIAQGSRAEVGTHHGLQWLLVGVQVTLSVALLSGAGLLIRSFDALSRVDPGFQPARVLTFSITGGYDEPGGYDRIVQRINSTLDELSALPDVEAAATARWLPGVGDGNQEQVELIEADADTALQMIAERRAVSPSYFETLSIPLLSGELCSRPIDSSGTTQVMVNRAFAQRYFPNRSIVGLHLAGGSSPDRIVGIVGDARETAIDRDAVPTVYLCFSAPVANPWFLVRTRGSPQAAAGTIRARLGQLEPLRALYDITPLEQRIGGAYAQNRLRTVFLVVFATLALALASLGIYGTLSYVVSLRRREVALRVALGARQSNIVSQFLMKVLGVVGMACAAGLVLSFMVGRALASMLYGVSAYDPVTLSTVIAVVLTVAALAALIPALRAAFIDPMETLRDQ